MRIPRSITPFGFLALLGLFLALPGCDDDVSGPENAQDTTLPVEREAQASDMTFWVPPDSVRPSQATATLNVESARKFTFQLEIEGLSPGHAVTLWGFDARALVGGWLAGGVVGEDGSLTLGGDNCVGTAQTETGLGISPDAPPACGALDLGTPVPNDLEATLTGLGLPESADDDFVQGLNVFLVDHGPWDGNAGALTTTEGILFGHAAFLFDLSDVF